MQLAALKKRRATIKGNVTKLLNYTKTINDKTLIDDIKVRLSHIDKLRSEFTSIEDQILELDSKEECDLEFEETYYAVVTGLSHALRLKAEPNVTINESILNTSVSGNHTEVKLPKITIPIFSGDYTEWQSFYDLFCSTIHDNPKLTASQKLQYLKGSVTGEAAGLLKHFNITDANYIEALKKLRERYDRRKHTIYTFIRNFISQPVVSTPNCMNVRRLLDTSDEILRELKAMGEDAETRDHWLIHIMISKLDDETNSLWAQDSADNNLPTIKQFFNFLIKRIDALESMKIPQRRVLTSPSQNRPNIKSHTITTSIILACTICPEQNHRLFECSKFNEMSVTQRKEFLMQERRCFNCLNDNHNVYLCKSRFRCRQCNKKHHTLLHEMSTIPSDLPTITANPEKPSTDSYHICTTATNNIGFSLLPTALVNVLDANNQYQLCRILLDSGSQGSFITENCVQKLQLRRTSAKLTISGIGATTSGYTRGAVSLTITPWNQPKPVFQIETFVFHKLTAKRPTISEYVNIKDFKQYALADPHFHEEADIDIIIGADIFFDILLDGKIVTQNNLILQNTQLGWVAAGKINEERPQQVITISVDDASNELENLLKRFWEVEAVENTQLRLSPEEELCEKCFESSKAVDNDGRFTVSLPFKIPPSNLGNSYPQAVQPLGHMQKITTSITSINEPLYYLPYHGVIKSTSTTTKLRVVFDGSAKSSSGKSLNDCLAVGPIIQSSLYDIISRFRKHKVVLTGDIEKMYRQVRITESDTRFQRIIWREEDSKPFNTYELLTVTYGTASASFLATRAVFETTKQYTEEFPTAVNCIKNDMYIDDLMTGAETVDEVIKLKGEIDAILSSRGFQLRKWLSNKSEVNHKNHIGNKDNTLEIDDATNNSTKLLGLHWDPLKDCFQFKVSLNDLPTTTKRGILSEASRLYDPLGWLAPVTIAIKIFFQKLWSEKLGWDDPLPSDLLNEWLKLRNNLPKIDNIELARYLNINSGSQIELHGFSDASKYAYSAVVYGKITNINGETKSKLLSAKTKVAPIKQLSIPRLELCGALLLSKLLPAVKKALQAEITGMVAWTDSTFVLDWLNAHPTKWNTFVGNRTGDILTNMSRSQWRHVESRDNPADCASRGLEPETLQQFQLWWNGPSWLPNADDWPKNFEGQSNTTQEMRNHAFSAQIIHTSIIDSINTKISSFNTLTRVLAYVLRFVDIKLKLIKKESVSSYLNVTEIQRAQRKIFHHIQLKYFETEMKLISSKKELPVSSKLKYYEPFLDESGLLRVGGRITNASITYNVKHPIILTAQDNIAESIIREHHLRHLHAGPTLMMATLRHKYWILGSRNLIRKVVHKCVRCAKYNTNNTNQIMGQLPTSRVELIKPFYNVGVDYAGPFQTYVRRGRGQKPHKSYICIFVCLATKAIHIELVSDLTTDAYLAALRRFTARRGLCKEILSDNGTNFVGARHHLYQFYTFLKQNVTNFSNFLLADEITFKFIPPSAPHFGGIWESAVRSVKFHLRRVTDGHILTTEEMTTLLVEIESMLNSRPICLLSNDDLDYLTPAHFLIGQHSIQLPGEDLTDINMSKLSRWQIVQKMKQHIWKRWYLEYLTTLQHQSKWHRKQSNVKIEDIVLIKENNLPPSKWLLGKVVQLHPGTDGNVRVVTLKTQHGNIKRPIVKLCRLPIT